MGFDMHLQNRHNDAPVTRLRVHNVGLLVCSIWLLLCPICLLSHMYTQCACQYMCQSVQYVVVGTASSQVMDSTIHVWSQELLWHLTRMGHEVKSRRTDTHVWPIKAARPHERRGAKRRGGVDGGAFAQQHSRDVRQAVLRRMVQRGPALNAEVWGMGVNPSATRAHLNAGQCSNVQCQHVPTWSTHTCAPFCRASRP